MCGIAGFWGGTNNNAKAIADEMALAIEHRGPNGFDSFLEASTPLTLIHRRLSIIDLSTTGDQPMLSRCGRYVLIFNGEIYNYKRVKADLTSRFGHIDWRGTSDTEVLMEALVRLGIDEGLALLNGMFAFAFWDKQKHQLYIARDRMGEKPLYYGRVNDTFLFGSELKALAQHPSWQGKINRDVLPLFFRHNYVPAPFCIYEHFSKLPPAHYIVVDSDGKHVSKPVCYWDIDTVSEQGAQAAKQQTATEEEYVSELESLLKDSIQMRMNSDVPLGAFLSGGIDSSTVVAIMQSLSDKPIQTFTMGFGKAEFDEAKKAKAIAKHIGTDHTEMYVSPEKALDVIPSLPHIWDEPFSDSSQIPTYLVSELARKNVTVSLSGDGGDELFCGYGRYFTAQNMWNKLKRVPAPLRHLVATGTRVVPKSVVQGALSLGMNKGKAALWGDRFKKVGDMLTQVDEVSFYRDFVSHWTDRDSLLLNCNEPKSFFTAPESHAALPGFLEKMMYIDSKTYLPDDILTKVDRASMAVSLEARVPLLDHRLVEFSWNLPTEFKYRHGQEKWILKKVLNRYVPQSLTDHPKQGFGVPIEDWLRGPLKDWAESLLNEKLMKEQGFFNVDVVRTKWQEHVSGKRRWHYYLWDVLMFQSWYLTTVK